MNAKFKAWQLAATVLIAAAMGQWTICPAAEESEKKFEQDTIKTEIDELTITFIGHGTLMFQYNGKTIHIDPVSREADYSKLPKADVVLITHEHGDHLDTKALNIVRKDTTEIVCPKACVEKIGNGNVEMMNNGQKEIVQGLTIDAVPAYNIVHERSSGQPFHPKGRGNGYVVTFGKLRVYIAGDTENIPEMRNLKKIDVAFLPMNLPYTMTPEMAANAAVMFGPKILYPYHYGQTNPKELVDLLKDEENIEVRIRKLR